MMKLKCTVNRQLIFISGQGIVDNYIFPDYVELALVS